MARESFFQTLARPYYWVNILVCLSYIVAKRLEPICSTLFSGENMCDYNSYETEIFFFTVVIGAMRSRKTGSTSMTKYLSSWFPYAKIANIIVWGKSDLCYGIVFGLVCLALAMTLPETPGVSTSNVLYFRSLQSLREELDSNKDVAWLVCFYVLWKPECTQFASIFDELSAQYGTELLKFGKVDVGRIPDPTKDLDVAETKLPVVLLFKNGVEESRQPARDAKRFYFSADNVRAAFGLNQLYKEAVELRTKLADAKKSK